MPPVGACHGWWQLALASVRPAEGLCGDCRSRVVVHGKDKVYGSIP